MTRQTQLSSEDIAEELATEQRSISVAEFFEKNKHMLGFDSPARALVTAVKEGVDNSLDACEDAGVLPDVFIEIEDVGDGYRVVVEDNGPGIVREQIPKIFGKLLYGSRFGKRVQSRGQQGIGISAAVLYSQLTSGRPVRITSKTRNGEAHRFDVIIDTDTNEPEIVEDTVVEWDRTRGTRIEMEMDANMRARQQLHDYVKHTAVVNPHARLHLQEPGGEYQFKRATDELPDKPEEIKPHPHGIELGTLIRMLEATDSYSLSGFLSGEFTRVGSKTVDSMLDEFRDRHYGREAAWTPAAASEIREAVMEAVANKSKEATKHFAEKVAEAVTQPDKATRSIVAGAVEDAAEEVDERFGDTVREKATEAAWNAVKQDRFDDVLEVVESATDTRKDEDAVRGLAERLAERFKDQDRATHDDVVDYVDRAADAVEALRDERFGEKSRENVVEAVWNSMRVVPDDVPGVREVAEDRDTARDLLDGMHATDVMAPPTGCLSPITAELVEEGLRKEFDAEFYSASSRDAGVAGGDPFVVEAGIAYGGSLDMESQVRVMRFANRVPLVYQQGACVTVEAIRDIGWKNYGLEGSRGSVPQGPAVIMVHVASTNVPFTSESKDAIASVPEIRDEVERAVREVGRDLKDYVNKRESRRKRREKQRVIQNIVPQIADKVSEVTHRDPPDIGRSLARILNKVVVSEGEGSIEVANYSNSKKKFKIHAFVDTEPTVNGDADVRELDGEYDVVWSLDLGKGERTKLEYSPSGAVTVEGLDDDLYDVVGGEAA